MPSYKKFLKLLTAGTSILGHHQLARAEEKPILEGAICAMSDMSGWSASPENLIGGSYKAFLHTSRIDSPFSDYSTWYRVELTEP